MLYSFSSIKYLYTDPLRIFNSFNWCHNVTDLGCLAFTKRIGDFLSESSIQEERPPFSFSGLSLFLVSPTKIQNGGSDVDAARELVIFNRRKKCDKFRR